VSSRNIANRRILPVRIVHEIRDTCLCLGVQRAARALARHFDEAFRPLGLTNGQFSLMMALNGAHPPAMGEVAAVLAMDRTTLTAALKALKRRGLVEVTADEKDKRSRRLILTPAGHSLLSRAYPLWKRAHAEIEQKLVPSETDRLRTDLTLIVQHLNNDR
jgi:DNA-binding MarR family transcriptional regulator